MWIRHEDLLEEEEITDLDDEPFWPEVSFMFRLSTVEFRCRLCPRNMFFIFKGARFSSAVFENASFSTWRTER